MAEFTAASNYKDLDGNMKTFTYIDHDIKTKMTPSSGETADEAKERKEWMATYLENTIQEVLSMPAVAIAGMDGDYEQLINRDAEKGITWNEGVLRQVMAISPMMAHNIPLLVWRNTVRESNWFHDMRDDHEAIVRGDWRSLM